MKSRKQERETLNIQMDQQDTILSPFQEQNLSFKTTMSSPKKFIGKCLVNTFMLAAIAMAGCAPKDLPKTVEPLSAERPALKLWIVDAPELEKVISVRWQAASDQTLKIEHFSIDQVATEPLFHADVVIYPAMLMGDLVQKQAIGRLPTQAIGKRESDSGSIEPSSSRSATWPIRWRNSATFGGQLYAIPLGLTNLAAVLNDLDAGPLNDLNSLLSSSRDFNAQSLEYWSQFLNRAEMKLAGSETERKQTLARQLSELTLEQKGSLVDRFLFLSATTNARNKGLFDLVKMESRINQVEFINSARILSRLANLFPDSIAIEPTKAWGLAISKADVAFALGWPSSITGASSDSSGKATVAQISWNPGRGLLASIGKKTRQTSVSCQFLAWLSEPEQREALRSVCSRVELIGDQNDRNNVRDDYRAFQAINNRDLRVEPMGLSLRMANANQYRAILAEVLVNALREPDKIDSIMGSCSSKWDQLTAKLGIETQRLSEEQSLGFSK